MRYNYYHTEIGTVQDALDKIRQPITLWDVWYFTNIKEETLLVQKTLRHWTFHYFEEEYYRYSFFPESQQDAEEILSDFLQGEDWEVSEDSRFHDWFVLVKSNSYEYVENFATVLDQAQIPFSVKKPNFLHFNAIFGTYYEDSPLLLSIPIEFEEQALTFRKTIETEIEKLHQQLGAAEDADDKEKQVTLYEKLGKLTPTDSIIFFNKAYLLFKLEKLQDAAEALIRSFNLDLETENMQNFEDTEKLLKKLLAKMPQSLDILHSLAVIASLNQEPELEVQYYQKILTINDSDSIAHLNLGHYYYSSDDEEEKAKEHFQKYLELEPEAEDREVIEGYFS